MIHPYRQIYGAKIRNLLLRRANLLWLRCIAAAFLYLSHIFGVCFAFFCYLCTKIKSMKNAIVCLVFLCLLLFCSDNVILTVYINGGSCLLYRIHIVVQFLSVLASYALTVVAIINALNGRR